MSVRFRAREFQRWSRRQFMLRAARSMAHDGQLTTRVRYSMRESFRRLRHEDARLARLFGEPAF